MKCAPPKLAPEARAPTGTVCLESVQIKAGRGGATIIHPPLHPSPLHLPQVPDVYTAPYTETIRDAPRRSYAGMVSTVDECAANITSALEVAGIYNDTMIIFSGDNGGWVGYGGLNTPYRGHKTTL